MNPRDVFAELASLAEISTPTPTPDPYAAHLSAPLTREASR